jgi:myo-inositol-1(or 4)-monophosphatase
MLSQLIEIAREAGAIIRTADHIESRNKSGPADFVTQYDERVERFVQQRLAALRPDAQFLGEESAHTVDEQAPLFIVDPIDGTTNFIRGFSQSAVSICFCEGGARRYAVIYDPYTDEVFSAEAGGGAFRNGSPIHVSDRPIGEAIAIFGTACYNREYAGATFDLARRLFDRTLDVRRFGAAVLDFCHVAAGRAELFCECLLSPWDFAAGALIVQEAGGVAVQPNGDPLPLTKKSALFCANAACADEREAIWGA